MLLINDAMLQILEVLTVTLWQKACQETSTEMVRHLKYKLVKLGSTVSIKATLFINYLDPL